VTADRDGLVAGAALLVAGRPDAAGRAFARAGDPANALVTGLVAASAALAAEGPAAERWAARARRRLDGVDGPVETGSLRRALATGASPPPLVVDGTRVDPERLGPGALGAAALAVAATTPLDESVVADAARYARTEVHEGGTRFATLLTDVVVGREPGVAYGRLRSLVERRRARERDVDGLF